MEHLSYPNESTEYRAARGLLDMTPAGRGDFFRKVNYDQASRSPKSDGLRRHCF